MAIFMKHSDSMRTEEIRVDVGSTDNAIRVVQKLIDDKFIKPSDFTWAYLSYDVKHLPDPDPFKNSHYPLNFHGSGIELYVSGVSAGYGGEGPAGTITILKMLGFKFTALQEQTITETTFDSDGNRIEKIQLHFDKYDR